LNVVLRRGHRVARAARDRVERPILDLVQLLGRCTMRVDRRPVPCRGEALHEIARRHDFDAELPNELDGPGIDTGDVRNRTLGRVLHRDALRAGAEPLDPRLELIAPGVAFGRTGEMIERRGLDRVHEAARLALCRNEIKPAPGREVAALPADARDLDGNRIEAAEVVEQPRIEAFGAQRRLDRRYLHRTSIAWLRRYNRSTPEMPVLYATATRVVARAARELFQRDSDDDCTPSAARTGACSRRRLPQCAATAARAAAADTATADLQGAGRVRRGRRARARSQRHLRARPDQGRFSGPRGWQ